MASSSGIVTITVADAMNASQGLEEIKTEKMPIKTAVKIANLIRFLHPICQKHGVFRNAQLNKWGVPVNDPSNSFSFATPENRAAFEGAISEDLAAQVVMKLSLKLSSADLESVKLSPHATVLMEAVLEASMLEQ